MLSTLAGSIVIWPGSMMYPKNLVFWVWNSYLLGLIHKFHLFNAYKTFLICLMCSSLFLE
jgi:hypothetical protein